MTDSKLPLNADKTEFLIIGTLVRRRKLDGEFWSKFNFIQLISETFRCCFYHIRDLRRIRRYTSLSVAKTTATGLVSSRLDSRFFL